MAFVRTPRGSKSRFSIARVANRISRYYLAALGSQTAHYRLAIQGHAQAVFLVLRTQTGDGNAVEWSRAAIQQAIEHELRTQAPVAVHERFLEETQKNKDPKPRRPEDWDRFSAMPEINPDKVDPVWGVLSLLPAMEENTRETASPLQDLGEPARIRKPAKTKAAESLRQDPARRSQWIEFFKTLARQVPHALDFEGFERQILRLPPDQKILDANGWWWFWQDQIDQSMLQDPRAVGFLRVLHDRRERGRLCGQSWLAGSGLDPHEAALTLSTDGRGQALYRNLWLEHIQRVATSAEGNSLLRTRFDLKALALRIAPDRDRLMDWRGLQWLMTSEALWPVPDVPWKTLKGNTTPTEAYELPQWAWMRVAMALAVGEPDPTAQALLFYEAFSSLSVIPSETMLREAGKAEPRYLEDEAGLVKDQFESIHEAIHRAAVGTKWTGTMALDWREVRAQGALIASRRISQGPIGFLRSINMSLAAQGRVGEDRPVTVSLPLWHRDIEGFIELRHTQTPRLQTVVSIPDLFFERLQKGQSWVLLDPAAYPEIKQGREEGYLAAEARWVAEGSKNSITAKQVSADKLWRMLTRAMAKGSPFLTFESSDRAFSPFPLTAAPLGGVDGVGALPVPEKSTTPFISWPSMAADISKMLDGDGNPDPDKMRSCAGIAMRALDNAIDLSHLLPDSPSLHYRPVCLGAVGFFEAVNRGSVSSQHDPELVTAWVSGLAEAWAFVVLQADQNLRKERGSAPAWNESGDATPFDPLGSVERLRTSRKGSLGHQPKPRLEWPADRYRRGHRCSVRTVWAPYQGAARVASVTPGGMGTLRPLDTVVDDRGRTRWCPTPLLMDLLKQRPEDLDKLREVLRHPDNPKKWPSYMVALAFPTAEGWERRLLHAAHIRPWIDQGVSLTLPAGLPQNVLATLAKRAWWMGLSNIRFEGIAPVKDEDAGEPEVSSEER